MLVPRLRLTVAQLDDIRAHARRGAPDEVCGVLVGRRAGDDVAVERVVPTRNAHPTPRAAYLVDPQELLSTVLRAEDEWGLEVIGFYHSHPAGPPGMSEVDRSRASWPGAAYLLVWLSPEEGVACWTWDGAAFVPRALDVR